MLQAYSNIDFRALADYFSPLKPFLFKNAAGVYSLDFKDEAANRTLTRALLKRDFGLEMTLLSDRLCPPVPNRLNYILWISSLVDVFEAGNRVVGLDIGTGSTAIYPLIACSTHNNWRFLATDIDAKSLAAAAANLAQNPVVAERIRLLPGTQDRPILFPLQPEILAQAGVGAPRPCVTFSMCNPPFYSDLEDVSRSADNKELDPHAVCTGASVEMITPGGEVNFVRRILDESISLQDMCGWYTSLLGKMSSLTALVAAIKEKGINNYAIGEIVQGNTRRWIIAWSFLDIRLPDASARPSSQSLKAIAPPPNTLRHTLPPTSPTLSYQALRDALLDIPKLRVEELQDTSKARVTAHEVTWTRSARRRLARNFPDTGDATSDALPLIMVSEVSIVDEGTFEVRWIRGWDRNVFESFWGHLSGRLSSIAP